jgi:hypothetical protein
MKRGAAAALHVRFRNEDLTSGKLSVRDEGVNVCERILGQ